MQMSTSNIYIYISYISHLLCIIWHSRLQEILVLFECSLEQQSMIIVKSQRHSKSTNIYCSQLWRYCFYTYFLLKIWKDSIHRTKNIFRSKEHMFSTKKPGKPVHFVYIKTWNHCGQWLQIFITIFMFIILCVIETQHSRLQDVLVLFKCF